MTFEPGELMSTPIAVVVNREVVPARLDPEDAVADRIKEPLVRPRPHKKVRLATYGSHGLVVVDGPLHEHVKPTARVEARHGDRLVSYAGVRPAAAQLRQRVSAN